MDRDRVRDLYLAAFSAGEREAVARLAVDLLAEVTTPTTWAWMAENDDTLVGHIGFSPVAVRGADHFRGYLLAPLAVHPGFQKRGIGTLLIESGIKHLSCLGVDIVFVYGDPRYYGRLGFDSRTAVAYAPPFPLQYEFGWQARLLTEVSICPSSGTLTCVESLMDPNLW